MFNFFLEHTLEIIVVLWVVAAARSILFWLYFIQLKQYRLDRIYTETKFLAFWKLFFSNYRIFVVALFVGWQAVVRFHFLIDLAFSVLYYLIFVFLLLWALLTAFLVSKKKLKLPNFTLKVWALFLITLVLNVYLASLYSFNIEQLLLLEFIQPIIVFLVFLLLYIPNFILQHFEKKRATVKIESLINLKVVGITGSYGKTSTKEFLSQILAKKFRTIKTPDHINVDTGIAKFVLKELDDYSEIFVVEMGADRPRDIKKIADIVKPDYGIMTGLNFQHLQYFKNFESLAKTKFELFDAVNDPKKLVANAESEKLVAEFKTRKTQPIYYGQDERALLQPENIAFSENFIHFKIGEIYFKAHAFGEAMLNNLLGAITAANLLGMTLLEVSERIKELSYPTSTMEMQPGLNGALFIDDSYNANTTGVITALHDLRFIAKTKKILFFREVIELGAQAETDHQLIADNIAQTIDEVVLLPSNRRLSFVEQLLKAGMPEENIHDSTDFDLIMQLINEDTVVLFEGPGTKSIMKSLQ